MTYFPYFLSDTEELALGQILFTILDVHDHFCFHESSVVL